MSTSDGIRSSASYIAESTYGTTPSTPELQVLRFSTFSPVTTIESKTSEEIRDDRNLAYARQGNKDVALEVVSELTYGTLDDFLEAATGDTWTSDVLKVGVNRRSFSFEQKFADINKYQIFTGAEISGINLSLTPGEIVSPSMSFVVRDSSAPASGGVASATYADANAANPMSVVNASIEEGGSSTAIVTQCDLSISQSMEAKHIVGSALTARPSFGRASIEGNVSFLYEDNTMLNKFLNGTESSLKVTLADSLGNEYEILLPAILYTGGETSVSGEGGITVPMPFTAYYDSTEDTSFKLTRTDA